MIGIVGNVNMRPGGYCIVNKTDTGLEAKVLSGSKILCTSCSLTDETTLISDGSVIKTTLGYDILKEIDVSIIKASTVALTILHGREFLYIEPVVSGSNVTFNLPKGTRINKSNIVETTGEFTMTSDTKYIIEY